MTSTNRAFIKAYRQDEPEKKATGGKPVILSEHRAAAFDAPELVRPKAVHTIAEEIAPIAVSTRHDRTTTRHTARPISSGRSEGAGERRPLSSYIKESRSAGPVLEDSRPQAFFRPGTTIASFQWPAVCRVLMQQFAARLDSAVNVAISQAAAGRSIVGVLGLFPRRGATTLSLSLAARLAHRGKRVVLVEANFSNPRMSNWLEAVPTAGWDETLKHAAHLSDAVIHAVDDRLDLLALGSKKVKDPLPLAAGLQAAVSAGVLRHAYELVLVDLGAYFDAASQPVVLELVRNLGVDGVFGVCGPNSADPRDLNSLSETLDRSGCQLLGMIENRIPTNQAAA